MRKRNLFIQEIVLSLEYLSTNEKKAECQIIAFDDACRKIYIR